MATNGLTIAGNNADLEISNVTDTYGFQVMGSIIESRGDGLSAGVSSNAPTYQDATPFSRTAWETFSGGFGQLHQDRVTGGTGSGGDSSRFFFSDGWTLKGDKLMPGLRRNLLYPTITNSGLDVYHEVPNGVLHLKDTTTYFTPTIASVFTDIRVLLKARADASVAGETITATLTNTVTSTAYTFTATVNVGTRYGFNWIKLNRAAGAVTLVVGNSYYFELAATNFYVGGYVADIPVTGGTYYNNPQAYFQLCPSGSVGTYKQWSGGIRHIQQTRYVNTYNSTVFTSASPTTMFNPDNPTAAETSLALTNVYTGSIVFDNNLYVGLLDNAGVQTTHIYAPSALTPAAGVAILTASGAANAATAIGISCCVEHEGNIYYVNNNTKTEIYKWGGEMPVTTNVKIIAANKIGKPNTNGKNPINSMILHRGMLYVFKPEGVFMIWDNPSKITTDEIPRIIKLVNLTQLENYGNGTYVIEHMGVVYFNVGNLVYGLTSDQSGPQVTVLVPPFPANRLQAYNYVNGLSSDGQVLYMSYNNIGVVGYNGTGYHMVTDYYESINNEGNPSGMRFMTNPTGATNYLWAGDGATLVRLPLPSYTASYSNQLTSSEQNRCFYWISSIWRGDLAEITKFLNSIILSAAGNDEWVFNITVASWTTGTPNYRNIIDSQLGVGVPRNGTSNDIPPLDPPILPLPGDPPASIGFVPTNPRSLIWNKVDFDNASASKEYSFNQRLSTNNTPVKVSFASLILNAWRVGNTPVAADLAYIESIVLKFMAALDYIPVYQLTLDLDALYTKYDQTIAQVNTACTFLRSMAGSKSPIKLSFVDFTGATKTLWGYIQSPQFEVDPWTVVNRNAPLQPVQKRMSFKFLAINSEYTGS